MDWVSVEKLKHSHLGVDPEGNVSLEKLIQTVCHSASHRCIGVSTRGMGVPHRSVEGSNRCMQVEGEEKKDKSGKQLVLR